MLKDEILSQLDRFASYLAEVEGKPLTTINAYVGDIRQLATMFSEMPEIAEKSVTAIRKPDANAYAKKMADSGMKASTRARKVKAARCFFRWLCEDAEVVSESVSNAFKSLKSPKIPQTQPSIITKDERDDLLSVVRTGVSMNEKAHLRDVAIMYLFLGSGIRRDELCNIEMKDVDLKERCVLIHGKGNKERYCYFSEGVAGILSEYIGHHRKSLKCHAESTMLFLSQQSERISLRAINNIVDKYLEASNLKEHGRSAHGLRKSFATTLYENTRDIYVVAAQLGHSGLGQIKRYVGVGNDVRQAACATVEL
jgi:integrase/recombinase XerC